MVYSGKPSKGCLPCREKRTKCDLALPSCTQCLRKNRVCTGYRDEQSLTFRNETDNVVQKIKRKKRDQTAESSSSNSSSRQSPSGSLVIQKPSRRVSIEDEAVLHFMGHYNEKFNTSFGHGDGGVDYITPVFQSDAKVDGPFSNIIIACGLSDIGNMNSTPDLVRQGKIRQVKVLRKLNQQLQDPERALTNSSVLTCLFLSHFDIIACDHPTFMSTHLAHVRAAVTLIEMRGWSQFADTFGHGIYVRVRGLVLTQCLQTREPLPKSIVEYMENEEIMQRDVEPGMVKLLARTCQLLSDHKIQGSMDEVLAKEAYALMKEWPNWRPSPRAGTWELGERPPAEGLADLTNPDTVYRIVWLAVAWVFQQCSLLLVSELLIEYTRSQDQAKSSPATSAAHQDSIKNQLKLVEEVKDGVCYYIENFATCKAAARTTGAHILLWPPGLLLSLSTTSPETFLWSVKQAERIADMFAIKQAKLVVDMIWMGIRASPGFSEPVESVEKKKKTEEIMQSTFLA